MIEMFRHESSFKDDRRVAGKPNTELVPIRG
jgi:hypothetical protein